MFDFTPFMNFFKEIATKFGAKLAMTLTSIFLILGYNVMETPTDTIAIVKYVCAAMIAIVFLFFRSKQDKLKNGEK